MRRTIPFAALFAILGCGQVETEQAARYRGALQAYCEEAAATCKRAESPHASAADIRRQSQKAEDAWAKVPDPPTEKASLHERAKKARGSLGGVLARVEIAELAAGVSSKDSDKSRKEAAGKAAPLRSEFEAIRALAK